MYQKVIPPRRKPSDEEGNFEILHPYPLVFYPLANNTSFSLIWVVFTNIIILILSNTSANKQLLL